MVQHMNMCGNDLDSSGSALAEGVWEYVNDLVKTYHCLENEGQWDEYHNQVSRNQKISKQLLHKRKKVFPQIIRSFQINFTDQDVVKKIFS